MDSDDMDGIKEYMQGVFESYSAIRDKKCDPKTPFWDIIVLTTFDETQRSYFLQQVEQKRADGHLPEVPIYVVADPPGEKLGVGGSTLHVLSELFNKYGVGLFNMRVLIIHSGGSSQRLPSYTFMGKIFTPVPIEGLRMGDTVPQMLDLKLAIYLPFCHLLSPGIFVACGDDIETYCLEPDALDKASLATADVVVLGHPGSPLVGTTHGVYVVKDSTLAQSDRSSVQECLEVLQKVPITTMREKGAVYRRVFSGGVGVEDEVDEVVWNDSVFWLGSGVCRRLLKWYVDNRPLARELDAYAHILPCLGVRMESAKPEDFTDYRREMLPLLRGASFKLIALPKSKFYHLGTMKEYIENFNMAQDFISELGLNRNTSNIRGKVCVECIMNVSEKEHYNNNNNNRPSQGSLIQCYFVSPDVRIQVCNSDIHYVIEYCQIGLTLRLLGNVILSNCCLVPSSSLSSVAVPPQDTVILLPSDTLFHTVPILYEGESLYVTVAFDLDSHMKAEATHLKDIEVFGKTLQDFCQILRLDQHTVIKQQQHQTTTTTTTTNSKVSLWNARIFTPAKTAADSFWITHAAVCKVKGEGESVVGIKETIIDNNRKRLWFSMKDLVGLKDLNTMLKERKLLGNLVV